MKKKILNKQERIFFKRWKNKPYAILNTLHKIIIVLSLPIVYLTVFHAETKAQDTVQLQELYVNSMISGMNIKDYLPVMTLSKSDISEKGVTNISDLLKFTTMLDIRQRGAGDAQTDVSLGGGNFDQVLILLNGIPINDYQTGHNSLNLPVDFSQIERIEILRSPSLSNAGFNAYTGAINIVTKNPIGQNLAVNQWFGQYGYSKSAIDVSFGKSHLRNFIAFTNVNSDGYTTDSDVKIRRFYMQNNINGRNFVLQFQTGLQLKNFGSYGFYTTLYPYQYESLNTSFASAKLSFVYKKTFSTLKIYSRRNQDKFELFREGENWYQYADGFYIKNGDTAKYVSDVYEPWAYYGGHNYHLSYTNGINYSLHIKNYIFAIAYNYFFIRSNVLGENADTVAVPFERDAYFTKKSIRQNISVSLAKKIQIFKNYSFTGAYSANYNFTTGYYGVFSLENRVKLKKINLYLAANQGYRLPTFTDMYYNGPTNVGNPNLKPEKNTTFTLASSFSHKVFSTNPQIFYRIGKDMIDWIIDTTDLKWHSANYGTLNTFGVQVPVSLDFTNFNIFIKNIKIAYTFLYQDRKETLPSKYLFDYAPHTFSISATFEPFKNFNVSINYLYKKRLGSIIYQTGDEICFVPYNDYHLLNARLAYKFKSATLFIEGSNLLDLKLYDYYTQLPGRWINAGFSINL